MKENGILGAAGLAFAGSEFSGKVNAVTGINYNKKPFMAGFIQGVRFYANHLYRKNFVQMIRSILDTKDTEESRPLEYEESVILYALKGFEQLAQSRDEMAKTIARLNRELAQTKERAKTNETNLKEQIKDLEYWLANISHKDK